jgi:RNA polymerase sigma factor (sigma-70 family)
MLDAKLKKVVNSIVAPYLREDVLQEVRLRVWELEKDKPGEDISGLAMMVARRTARRVSMRAIQGQNPWTGSSSLVGKTRGDFQIVHGDMPMNEDQQFWDHYDFAQPDSGYENVEISAVVDSLPTEDAELVRMRFWDGATFKEIGTHFGISKDGAEKRWKRIRLTLRSELEDSVR